MQFPTDDESNKMKYLLFSGRESNFNKEDPTKVDSFGSNYDYGSVMHYSERVFSTSNKATIKAIGGQSIGQRNGPSDADIFEINKLYHCSSK